MKAIFLSKALLIGILVVIIPACALDAEGPDGDPSAADAETMSDAEALALAALPTCDSVRDYFNAAVPDVKSNGSVNCVMGHGANSPAVGRLQRTMNVCYGEQLDVDNDFGTRTQAALERTQKKAGAKVDGVYGPMTRMDMLHQSNDNANQCIHVP